ncbi:MAG: hypothetical protein ACODAQ_00920 [Phycisphaeraceae bacterium]
MRIRCVDALPPQAWLWHRDGADAIELTHGKHVRLREDVFFEGCMPTEDLTALADQAEVFGSGGVRQPDGWLFVPPSHTLEAIYVYRHHKAVTVSNSLAFLASYLSLDLPWHPSYAARFASAVLGIEDYRRHLGEARGGSLSRYVYDNIRVDASGTVEIVRKPEPPSFDSYAAYIDYVSSVVGGLFADGVSDESARNYRPLATCSRGYDSPCTAALAARHGCREAVTLANSRQGGSDDGSAVGEALGLTVHRFDRPDRVSGGFGAIAEFLATGMGGEDYCYKAFQDWLPGRIFITGFHGGAIWGLQPEPNDVLARKDISGASLQEYRLWTDFVHVPVPMIAARRHPDISRISHSPEMSAYRLNCDYDRPIPRRVLEEAGVPRDAFGQKKQAASILVFQDRTMLGDQALRERNEQLPWLWRCRAYVGLHSIAWHLRMKVRAVCRRCYPYAPHLSRRIEWRVIPKWQIFEHAHPACSFDMLAAIKWVARRYQTCLRSHAASQESRR